MRALLSNNVNTKSVNRTLMFTHASREKTSTVYLFITLCPKTAFSIRLSAILTSLRISHPQLLVRGETSASNSKTEISVSRRPITAVECVSLVIQSSLAELSGATKRTMPATTMDFRKWIWLNVSVVVVCLVAKGESFFHYFALEKCELI